jgi:hypothetical protein
MTQKFTITVTDFRAHHRNTLRGFCMVHVDELKLTLHDVAIHEHANGSRWVSLPAKPVIDNSGNVKRNAEGRIEYAKLFSFDTRGVSDAFSAAVITALLERDARAFDALPATGG